MSGWAGVFEIAAAASAGCVGWMSWQAWQAKRDASARWAAMRRSAGLDRRTEKALSLNDRILKYLAHLSQTLALGASRPLLPAGSLSRMRRWFVEKRPKAGLSSDCTADGFLEASLRLGLAFMAACALLGALFSEYLLVIGALVGFVAGCSAPLRALKALERDRSLMLGRDLPEMLEVCALGLRSGLSFDRSFALYGAHFDTALAQECAHAQSLWSMGLASREDALRGLAQRYDSKPFRRIVESMVRSLRFGSSLVEVLESSAGQARADYRAAIEEKVAKAPVKMMVPTGALILPAMLLLVLGPVLLQLMEGL